jgi:hypothetical protein
MATNNDIISLTALRALWCFCGWVHRISVMFLIILCIQGIALQFHEFSHVHKFGLLGTALDD